MSTTTLHTALARPGRIPFLWLLGLALLAVSAAGAGWVIHTHAGDAAPRTAKEASPAEGRPERTVNCKGHVDVENGVTSLAPSQPYEVLEVLARENMQVKAGAVLIRVKDLFAKKDLQKAEITLKGARVQLAKARKGPEERERKIALQQLSLEAVQRKLRTARDVLAGKKRLNADPKVRVVSEVEMILTEGMVAELEIAEKVEKEKLRALQEIDTTQEDIDLAETNVGLAEQEVERARHAVELCELRAPEDGKVVRVYANPGDHYGPQSRQPALLFLANRPRIVRAEVGQEFAARIREGQQALIQDESRTGETYAGKVVRVAEMYTPRRSGMPELFPLNDERTLEFIIQLDSDQVPLRLGQRVYVTLK